jgi:hypothetical protein
LNELWLATECAARDLDSEECRDFRLVHINRWTRPWQKPLPMIAKHLDHHLGWGGEAESYEVQYLTSGYKAWVQAMEATEAEKTPPKGPDESDSSDSSDNSDGESN